MQEQHVISFISSYNKLNFNKFVIHVVHILLSENVITNLACNAHCEIGATFFILGVQYLCRCSSSWLKMYFGIISFTFVYRTYIYGPDMQLYLNYAMSKGPQVTGLGNIYLSIP